MGQAGFQLLLHSFTDDNRVSSARLSRLFTDLQPTHIIAYDIHMIVIRQASEIDQTQSLYHVDVSHIVSNNRWNNMLRDTLRDLLSCPCFSLSHPSK